jgi:hypothetical protein
MKLHDARTNDSAWTGRYVRVTGVFLRARCRKVADFSDNIMRTNKDLGQNVDFVETHLALRHDFGGCRDLSLQRQCLIWSRSSRAEATEMAGRRSSSRNQAET